MGEEQGERRDGNVQGDSESILLCLLDLPDLLCLLRSSYRSFIFVSSVPMDILVLCPGANAEKGDQQQLRARRSTKG
jgi:hypothetical protein